MRRSNLAFESQHLLHAVDNAGIKNWVSLSEGQQGTLGWLTVRVEDTTPCTCARLLTQLSFLLCAQTNERKVRAASDRTPESPLATFTWHARTTNPSDNVRLALA